MSNLVKTYRIQFYIPNMTSRNIPSLILVMIGLVLLILSTGCTSINNMRSPIHRSHYENLNKLMHEEALLEEKKPFLKAHLNNGEVILFTNEWSVDTTRNVVTGLAQSYDINRRPTSSGIIELNGEDVVLFETNALNSNIVSSLNGTKIMFLVTAASLFVCIVDPKICYGSCPTFYLDEKPENVFSSDAEGFSSAIHPTLEYKDCDGLGTMDVIGKSVSLTMKNEALETHCIEAVSLTAIPIEDGERIYHNPDNNFWRCTNSQAPSKAEANKMEVSALLASSDLNEYHRWTENGDMTEVEDVYLTFPGIPNTEQYGLVLDFRQSLMSTYLFYGAKAYMGPLNSDYYVEFGKSSMAKPGWKPSVFKEMGGIDVSVWDLSKKQWKEIGTFDETGPIAINTQMLELGGCEGEVKVRLRMTIGAWRIDAAQLVQVVEKLNIEEWTHQPSSIRKQQGSNQELFIDPKLFTEDDQHFVSMPGESFVLDFDISDDVASHELFLFSKGYYIEWMRGEWLGNVNRKKIRQMHLFPKKYLKQEAEKYQMYEEEMERLFWESKVTTPIFTYHAD